MAEQSVGRSFWLWEELAGRKQQVIELGTGRAAMCMVHYHVFSLVTRVFLV